MSAWRIAGLIAMLAAGPAAGSEIILFDDANCAGTYRVLIESEADLDRVEFGNAAASVRVVAGTWTLFRDDNFQSNNGPPVTLPAGDCVNLGVGPTAQFPPELMDSVQLTAAAPGPGSAIVLYDGTNLSPPYRVLTSNTPDLDAMQFDNRISSFQVVSGLWRIFRDDGFQSNNGPPIEVGVGVYANIEDLGFPSDRASSVLRMNVASDPQLPPPVVTVDCPPGSATNGAVCVSCVELGQVVAASGGACECPADQRTIGGRVVDGIPIGLCQRELVVTPPQDPTSPTGCPAGEVMAGSLQTGGGCVPCPENSAPNPDRTSCQCNSGYMRVGYAYYGLPECAVCDYGSIYDAASGTCVCPAGMVQASTDGSGMPMCVRPSNRPVLVEHVVDGWDAYQTARRHRFAFTTEVLGIPVPPVCVIGIQAYDGLFSIEFRSSPGGGHCTAMLFDDRALREPWELVSWTLAPLPEAEPICSSYIIGAVQEHSDRPQSATLRVDMHHSPPASFLPNLCVVVIGSLTLRGPADADPLDAFR